MSDTLKPNFDANFIADQQGKNPVAKELIDLLKSCCSYDPTLRPTSLSLNQSLQEIYHKMEKDPESWSFTRP